MLLGNMVSEQLLETWMGGNSVSSNPPPGGWKKFERMDTNGDDMPHTYELKITKYPSVHDSPGGEVGGDGDADVIGTSHLSAATVQDPSPPSEKAAKYDMTRSSMELPTLVLTAMSGSKEEEIVRLPLASPEAMCDWRKQKHRDFWHDSPAPQSRSSGIKSSRGRGRGGYKVVRGAHSASMRQQAESFFASPASGRPTLLARQ